MKYLYFNFLVTYLVISSGFSKPTITSNDGNRPMDYYCKPTHYLSSNVQWQRVDSGVSVTSTNPIKSAKIWMPIYEATSDGISIQGDSGLLVGGSGIQKPTFYLRFSGNKYT